MKIFNRIENNGNAHFENNGEKHFLENLMQTLAQKEGEKEKIVFDVGANVGNYAQMLMAKSNKLDLNVCLHLFEPTQSCFTQLQKKFDNNSTITLNCFGVSDSDCTATIYYNRKQSGLASLYQRNLDYCDITLDQHESIKLRRLDHYINKANIMHIDFLKIDIEGHELNAFEGLGKYLHGNFIDYIQFEYGGANLDSHSSLLDFYTLLSNKGFIISKVMPSGLEIRNYSPFMENFYYSNYVAISTDVLKRK